MTHSFPTRRASDLPVMGGEDFGRFGREDKSIKSLTVWVGGVPQAEYDAAKKDGRTLPSLHRSEEHTSELQPLMRTSYAVFCLKKTHNKSHLQLTKLKQHTNTI